LCDSATVVLTRCFKLLSFFTMLTFVPLATVLFVGYDGSAGVVTWHFT